MYFAFIVVTTAKAIATFAAVAETAVLIVKRLSNLRGKNTDSESPQHADKNSVPASGIEQEAHENLEMYTRVSRSMKNWTFKEEGTKKGLEEKVWSSHWDVHGKEQPS